MHLASLTTLVLPFAAMMANEPTDNMKAFPAAEPGMVRHVLKLSPQDDESAYRVELMVGKTVELDKANKYFFGGRIEEETIKGWGFTRFLVKTLGPMAGTLIAIDPNAPQVSRFITLGGDPLLIRYNSRLPIVVYVPEDAEVRYRIWQAQPEITAMDAG